MKKSMLIRGGSILMNSETLPNRVASTLDSIPSLFKRKQVFPSTAYIKSRAQVY